MVSMTKLIREGSRYEKRFEQWCDRNHLEYLDNRKYNNCVDYLVKFDDWRSVDVKKLTYPTEIILEWFNNCEPLFGSIRKGWFLTTTAELIAWVGDDRIIFGHVERLKKWWVSLSRTDKQSFQLIKNRVSYDHRSGKSWQSAFRRFNCDTILEKDEGTLRCYAN